jgi:hypothetical protein
MTKKLTSLSRRDTAELIKDKVVRYWAKKVYSCYREVGLLRRGRLRADIFAFNMKRNFIICEVKSCWSDFATDNKWSKYLDHCHKMYICITEDLWLSKSEQFQERLNGSGVGIMVVGDDGVRVVRNAKANNKALKNVTWMLTKLAWAGGESRASLRRR